MLPEVEIEKLTFEVDVKRIDEENFVAEFTKLGGEKAEFFEVYDEFVNFTQVKN
jgi:hypothetical protein